MVRGEIPNFDKWIAEAGIKLSPNKQQRKWK